MALFPSPLQIGEGATPNELDLDKGLSSSQLKRYRDRDQFLLDGLNDGAAGFDLNVKSLTTSGDVVVGGDVIVTGSLEFPEKLLIFSNI